MAAIGRELRDLDGHIFNCLMMWARHCNPGLARA